MTSFWPSKQLPPNLGSDLATKNSPAIVLHPTVPAALVVQDQGLAIVGLPGHGPLGAWMGVVLGTVGTHVNNRPMGKDLVVDVGGKGDLKGDTERLVK